jgi:hypothetical protein
MDATKIRLTLPHRTVRSSGHHYGSLPILTSTVGHDRNGGWSGKAPQLKNVKRVLQVTRTSSTAPLGLRRAAHGGLEPFGGDGGKVVVASEVVLNDGKSLHLPGVQQKAIDARERLFQQFGLSP